MVFIGDGYTAAALQTSYGQHIQATLNHLFNEGEDPYPRYRNFFNVHRVDVVSQENGADVPPEGIFRNTALDATYYSDGVTERSLNVNPSKVTSRLVSALAGAPFGPEIRVIPVNDTRYGGTGGSGAVYAAGNFTAPEIALHEIGHSFNGLADEYGGSPGAYPFGEPIQPNVTINAFGTKWAHWLGYNQPGIGVIGAYQGGLGYDLGIYRPSLESKMRSLYQPFDAIAREKIILDIYNRVDPLDAYTPNVGVLSDPTLEVDPIDANVIRVNWFVNGTLVPGATATTFDPADFGYGPGAYTVSARAFDPTEWVRINLTRLEQSVSWDVVLTPEPALGGIVVTPVILLACRRRARGIMRRTA
jgi:hypothetical protein